MKQYQDYNFHIDCSGYPEKITELEAENQRLKAIIAMALSLYKECDPKSIYTGAGFFYGVRPDQFNPLGVFLRKAV